jgi:catechol 2,3-dioxygenase-like lactoylglutathione lyase family enzyme
MINAVHTILYARDADAARAFFGDVLGLDSVDAGGGWLIFALPPAELAVHPGESPSSELYLMTDDLPAFLATPGVEVVDEPVTQRWGVVARISVPGYGPLGVYQPSHPVPRRAADHA